MSTNGLVLSIFPGIDLLGRAFEEEDYSVVRGPDPLWGGDIRTFHVPAGVFKGVIGGPPCQHWTRLMFLNPRSGEGMDWVVSEYARIVEEAQPAWFLMEEVPYAPMPLVPGYHDYDVLLRDNQVSGVQPRERRFTFGTPDCRMLNVVGWEQVGEGNPQSILGTTRAVPVRIGGNGREKRSILSSGNGSHGEGRAEGRAGVRLPGGRTQLAGHSRVGREHLEPGDYIGDLAAMCEAQGLPPDFTDKMPFTKHGKQLVLGNGVPRPMGRAIARAVKAATR